MCSLMPAPSRSYPVQVGELIEQGAFTHATFTEPYRNLTQRRILGNGVLFGWYIAGPSLGKHVLTRGGCEVGGCLCCGQIETPYLTERDKISGIAATSAVVIDLLFVACILRRRTKALFWFTFTPCAPVWRGNCGQIAGVIWVAADDFGHAGMATCIRSDRIVCRESQLLYGQRLVGRGDAR
jgi:hypothetical protein